MATGISAQARREARRRTGSCGPRDRMHGSRNWWLRWATTWSRRGRQRGDARARRGGRDRERRDTGRADRSCGHGGRPDPGAAGGRAGPRRRSWACSWTGSRPMPRTCRSRRLVRRGAVLHRGDVRSRPRPDGRRAGPGMPAGRHHRDGELDTGRLRRGVLPGARRLRPTPAGGNRGSHSLGRTRSCPEAVRRPGGGPALRSATGDAGVHRLPAGAVHDLPGQLRPGARHPRRHGRRARPAGSLDRDLLAFLRGENIGAGDDSGQGRYEFDYLAVTATRPG